MGLKQFIMEQAKKYDESSVEEGSRLSHSDAYHRFFEGYSELKVVDPSGRIRIRRIYTGVHYRPRLSRKQMVLLRLLYPPVFAAAVALFLVAALRGVPSNTLWYAALPQACTLPMLVWFLISFLSYLPIKEQLEIGEYNRSSVPLKRAALIGAVCALLSGVMALVSLFGEGGSALLGELCTAGLFMLAAALLFLIGLTEARIPYDRIDSTTEIPAGGVEID
jgi:hypothetical protein